MAVSPSSSLSSSAGLAIDSGSTSALRASAGRDPKTAIKEVAKQFEALFMQQLMKSMREATTTSGMLDNAGSNLATGMLDSQYASQMSGLHGGLGDMIARQLERQMGGTAKMAQRSAGPVAAQAAELRSESGSTIERQADFLRRHQGAADAAAAQTGIPAAYTLGQAAHESGWGRREIRNADGSTSYNLFGIKAGGDWKGPVAEVTTTEYVNGEPRKMVQKFRAYASYEESFRDYATLMKGSPRYGGVMAQAAAGATSVQGFAQGLQRAGYATDPAYAEKLTRVINTTLRLQRTVA